MLMAKPFPISLEHARQVMAKAAQPAADHQAHAAYIAELLARAQRGEIQDAYSRMMAELEPELFRQAIKLAHGNQAKAARWLGVTRLKMRETLAQLGLHPRNDQ
jgi:DNA-binding protein Fis